MVFTLNIYMHTIPKSEFNAVHAFVAATQQINSSIYECLEGKTRQMQMWIFYLNVFLALKVSNLQVLST
jgi:hypothetical protein